MLLGHLQVVANFEPAVIGPPGEAKAPYLELTVVDYIFPYMTGSYSNEAVLYLLHVLTPQQKEVVEKAAYVQWLQENLLKEQIDLDNDKVLHDRQVQQWKNQLVHVEMPVRRLDPDLKY